MRTMLAENILWNLSDLYTGPEDQGLIDDREWLKKEARRLQNDYKGRIAELKPDELKTALRRYERFLERIQKIISYAGLNFAVNTNSPQTGALWQGAVEMSSELSRDTQFFELELKALDEPEARGITDAAELREYRHYLEQLRKYVPHTLSDPEERVMTELSPVGKSSWVSLFDKVVSNTRYGEAGRTQSDVLRDLYDVDRAVRERAAAELTNGLQTVLPVVTHIFNTTLLDRAIHDRLRAYPHWLAARNLGNEADDRIVQSLVEAVADRYDMVKRYYELKKKLLGYRELFDYDRYAPLFEEAGPAFGWDRAREIVLSAFAGFSPDMAGIAEKFFIDSWIHAPAIPGKRGGAFAHPTVPGCHPYVMLNFTGSHRDVMTLAHELGHGVHQFLARKQGLFNCGAPLTMAETASVFGETVVFQGLLNRTTDRGERLALLCSNLEDSFATVFRQIAMHRFEDSVHKERREKGELSPDRISELWMKTQGEMFEGSVTLLDHYGIWWSYIPHFIHTPGYVYAYAFGKLLALALYRKYRERGDDFIPQYLELLEAGGKDAPQTLLEPLQVDLEDPGFWKGGLAILEESLEEAESLAG